MPMLVHGYDFPPIQVISGPHSMEKISMLFLLSDPEKIRRRENRRTIYKTESPLFPKKCGVKLQKHLNNAAGRNIIINFCLLKEVDVK